MNQPSFQKNQNLSGGRQQNASAYSQPDSSAYAQQYYAAQGQMDRHLIRFINYDGSVIQSRTYVTGETVTMPVVPPTIQSGDGLYQFAGWSPNFSPTAQGSVDYYISYTRGGNSSSGGWKKRTTILLAALAAVVVLLLVVILAVGGNGSSNNSGSSRPGTSVKQDDDDDRSSNRNDDDQDANDSGNSNAQSDAPAEAPVEETAPPAPACKHNWEAATVYNPSTCSLCGATSGSPLPSPHSVDNEWERIGSICEDIMDTIDVVNYERVDYNGMVYYYYYTELVLIRETVSTNLHYYYDAYGNLVFSRDEVDDELYYYYDADGELMLVVNAKGNPGLGSYSSDYRRYYYFHDGELLFAHYEGSDAQRLYFYQGHLMRWLYRNGDYHNTEDYSYSNEFLMWEQMVLDELAYLGIN